MYLDLKERFWWTGMKKDIAEYVAVCDVCQRVKGGASEASWIATAIANTRMEVG